MTPYSNEELMKKELGSNVTLIQILSENFNQIVN